MDFTLDTYRNLLETLQKENYSFQTFDNYLTNPDEKVVLLRHDVDKLPGNSLETAKIESELKIRGTYYFRIVPESFDKEIIIGIMKLGHEIGYHYEDVDLVTRRNPSLFNASLDGIIGESYRSFLTNLIKFKELYDIKTICMHGSPTAKYDNKIIWQNNNYKDLGIIGEPYFDIDFNEFGYLTDTGRRWNGDKVSVRYKVSSKYNFNFKTTKDIIKNIESLPQKIMITIHPQRWHSEIHLVLKEYVLQNIKNTIKKYFYVKKQ